MPKSVPAHSANPTLDNGIYASNTFNSAGYIWPNIMGQIGVDQDGFQAPTGCFGVVISGGWIHVAERTDLGASSLTFDASKSNSLYSGSSLLMPLLRTRAIVSY